MHCLTIRQASKIVSMEQDVLRTGDRARVTFEFMYRPEYMVLGTRLIFREGRTKGIGKVRPLHLALWRPRCVSLIGACDFLARPGVLCWYVQGRQRDDGTGCRLWASSTPTAHRRSCQRRSRPRPRSARRKRRAAALRPFSMFLLVGRGHGLCSSGAARRHLFSASVAVWAAKLRATSGVALPLLCIRHSCMGIFSLKNARRTQRLCADTGR